MAITYKLWKKKFKNAQNEVQEKYLACKVTTYTLSTKEMVEQINNRSTYDVGDMNGSISELSEMLKTHLPLGHNVNIKGIGTFSISITSNMIDSREDISKLKIRGNRIVFRPDPELVELLSGLHFNYINNDPLKKEIKG